MIDQDFKTKLASALKEAVSRFNAGECAIDAVSKTAIDMQFSPDACARLTEQFNTARLHHMRSVDKLAQFDVLDSNDVVLRVFNAPLVQPKRACVAELYAEYAEPVRKVAGADDAMAVFDALRAQAAPAEVPDGRHVRNAKIAAENSLEQLADAARTKLAALREACAARITAAADSLLGHPFATACAHVAKVAALVGQDADKQASYKLFLSCVSPALRGAAGAPTGKLARYAVRDQADDIYKVVADTASELNKAAESVCAIEKLAAETKASYTVGEGVINDSDRIRAWFSDAREQRELCGKVAQVANDKADQKGQSQAKPEKPAGPQGFVESIVGLAPSKQLTGLVHTGGKMVSDVHKQREQQGYTAATNRLDDFRRGIELQALVATDPVLADADPTRLGGAIETIYKFAPHMLDNRPTTLAILRQAVQTDAVSPFDAKALADLEKAYMQNVGQMPKSPAENV